MLLFDQHSKYIPAVESDIFIMLLLLRVTASKAGFVLCIPIWWPDVLPYMHTYTLATGYSHIGVIYPETQMCEPKRQQAQS